MSRTALLVAHTGRPEAIVHAQRMAAELVEADFVVRVLAKECDQIPIEAAEISAGADAAAGVEIVVALGGDGTFLRAASLARPVGAPLLGVNLGHVGFLAEAEAHHLPQVARRIAARDYDVEERMTLRVEIRDGDEFVGDDWALNEVSVERSFRERILETMVSIDGNRVSHWGCDGVLAATPTGSTAYAFSAGGPVLWPNVAGILIVPVSAHALFHRALVVGVDSVVTIQTRETSPAVVSCDGHRTYELGGAATITVSTGLIPVRVVRLRDWSFTDRLVAKFGLDVNGWRNRSAGTSSS